MAQCQKSGSRAKKILSQKRFSKNNWCCLYTQIWKWCKRIRRSYMSMLGSILLLVIKKNIVLQTFEFCSDCRCDRHVADIKTKFSIPRKTSKICQTLSTCHKMEKYLSNDKKISVLFAILILMSALFLVRYYGSWYRLQHVEKQRTKHRRGKKDVSKKIEHAKRKQKRNMQKKAKKGERWQKKEKGPKLHAAAW